MKSFGLGVVVILCLALAEGQTGNYLLAAFDSAMEVKAEYISEADFFRERLTWQADDFGYYFTTRMRYALAQATTPAQGAALRECAAVAAATCQESINRFDDSLQALHADANQLHSSVHEQLMDTNIKAEDLELFYYYHSYRMEAARDRLFDVHIMELGNRWADMWFLYFDISEALDECISLALALAK